MHRRNIAELPKKEIFQGMREVISRSYPSGEKNFFRIYENDKLELTLRFENSKPGRLVKLHGNFFGQWEDLDFIQSESDPCTFNFNLKMQRTGRYRFRAKHSVNNGETWFWDLVPHTEVMVDPEDLRSLRMYTFIPTVSGHIGEWIESLHRIKSLGFNAIHLLPITKMSASTSPYAAFDLFEIDDSYLIPGDNRPGIDQFEDFVQAAKDVGMKLCFDLVLNHVGATSRMAQECPDWLVMDLDEPDTLKRAGCWVHLDWLKWEDLVLIQYEHPNFRERKKIWEYMKSYALFWAHYANETGGLIRLDNLHSTPTEFLGYLMRAVKKEYPHIAVLAELFTNLENLESSILKYSLNLILATPWSNSYAKNLREFIKFQHNRFSQYRYFIPVNSHDSGTTLQEYGSEASLIPIYAVFALLGTGQTGLVQGAEYGIAEKINFIGRHKKLELSPESTGFDFSSALSRINQLMSDYRVFSEPSTVTFCDGSHGAFIVALRKSKVPKSENETAFLVIANLDTVNTYELSIPLKNELEFIRNRPLMDVLTENSVQLGEATLELTLKPSETYILKISN